LLENAMKTIQTIAKPWRHLTLLALMLTLSFALGANARPGGKGRGFGKGERGPRGGPCHMLKKADIGLTEDQQAQLQPICDAMPERMKPLFEEIGRLREEIRAEMKKDEVDLNLVGALHQQIASVKTEMAGLRVETRNQLRGILDTEQLAKLEELKEKRRARRGSRGRHGGPGGGFGGDEAGSGPGRDCGGSCAGPGGESW
jgi:Spy/CpxP family protein refolding chaperone